MNDSKKKCRECGKNKPASEFSLVSKATSTRRTICKACNTRESKAYQKRNRNSGSVSKVSDKKCSRCKKTKPITKFSKDSSTNSGWRAICKACASTTFKIWRKEDGK